jgi:methylated-DNA-protein-cysteine methyltransferase-like protein
LICYILARFESIYWGMQSLSERIVKVIKKIPKGKVASYGQIADLAGNRMAARQVVRILHALSEKKNLPWYRVINSRGTISLKAGEGYEIQKGQLISEGIVFDEFDRIDLERFGWKPKTLKL